MVPGIRTRALSAFLLIVLLFIPLAGAADPVVRAADLYKAPESSKLEKDIFAELNLKTELYNQKFDEIPALFQPHKQDSPPRKHQPIGGGGMRTL